MDFNLLKSRLADLTVKQRKVVAKRAKVGYTTINNIVYGATDSPGFKTLTRLEKAMK